MNQFFAAILNEAFRSPDHKTFFSFILGCLQDFNFARPFRPFSPVSTQPYQNGQTKLKSSGHPRIKLKKGLWSGDLKASLRIAAEKLIHKTSSKFFIDNQFDMISTSSLIALIIDISISLPYF